MGDQYSSPILWNLRKAIGHQYVDEIKYEYFYNTYTENFVPHVL